MQVHNLDHFTLRTSRLDDTRAFYEQVIGLTPGPRPAFAFPGAWLYAQGQPLLHLAAFDPSDASLARYLGSRPTGKGSGCVDHITFRCTGLQSFEQRLRSMGVAFDGRTVPELKQHQLFVVDPNGVRIECIFHVDETVSWSVDAEGIAVAIPSH